MLKQGFRNKREAQRALDELRSTLRNGTVVNRSSVELSAFLDDWLVSQRSRLKEATWASYEVAVARI